MVHRVALIGRASECPRLDSLLDEARGGLGSTLVLRGEAGVGKTALVGYAMRSATDFRVLEVTGVESEQGLPYRVVAPIAAAAPR